MSRPALSLVVSNPQPAMARKQVSLPRATPEAVRDNLALLWGRFCLANFADSTDCAETLGCTRQCADNWLDGDRHRPSGHFVVYAIDLFGPALAAYLAGPADAPAPRLRSLPQLRQVA